MAKMNGLCMNEDEMNNAVSGFNKCSTGMGTAGTTASTKFSRSGGMLSGTSSKISKQLNALSSALANTGRIIQKHNNEMFTYDKTMASMAEDIDIPQDFISNDSAEVNTYEHILLSKLDGKSVNEGETAKEFNEIDDSVVSGENLTNINNNETQEQEYDGNLSIGKSVLGNISNDGSELQEYDDASSIGQVGMGDISSDQTQEKEYDDSSSVNQSTLGSIANGQTQAQDYDDTLSIGKSVLGNMTGGAVNTSAYDASSSIAANTQMSAPAKGKTKEDEDREKQMLQDAINSTNILASMTEATYNNEAIQAEEERLEEVANRE